MLVATVSNCDAPSLCLLQQVRTARLVQRPWTCLLMHRDASRTRFMSRVKSDIERPFGRGGGPLCDGCHVEISCIGGGGAVSFYLSAGSPHKTRGESASQDGDRRKVSTRPTGETTGENHLGVRVAGAITSLVTSTLYRAERVIVWSPYGSSRRGRRTLKRRAMVGPSYAGATPVSLAIAGL